MTSFTAKLAAAQSFSGSARPKFTIGSHLVKVVGAEYGPNQAKTGFRGLWKVECAEGECATALTNTYLTAGKDDAQSASNLKPYFDILLANGIAAEKIEGDAQDWQDIINNIVSYTNRLLRAGTEIYATLSIKVNPKNAEQPWKNIFPVVAGEEAAAPLDMPSATATEAAAFAAATKDKDAF